MAAKLGLSRDCTQQNFSGFNTQRRVEVENVNLSIHGVTSETDKRSYDVSNVLAMSDEHMPSISTSLPHQINMNDYPHLCDIENPVLPLDRVDLLLGIDNYHLFKAMESIESASSGLFTE